MRQRKTNSFPLIDGTEAQGFYMAHLDGILCWEPAVSFLAALVGSVIWTIFNLLSVFLSHSEGRGVVPPKEAPARSLASAFASESMLDQETLIQDAADPT